MLVTLDLKTVLKNENYLLETLIYVTGVSYNIRLYGSIIHDLDCQRLLHRIDAIHFTNKNEADFLSFIFLGIFYCLNKLSIWTDGGKKKKYCI